MPCGRLTNLCEQHVLELRPETSVVHDGLQPPCEACQNAGKPWDYLEGGQCYIYLSHGRRRRVIECDCGEWVQCRNFTNWCDCGADYNMSGQRLAPREQWGEETGESVSDILAGDTDPWGGEG